MNKLKYINLTVLYLSISFLIISCSTLSPQKPSKLTPSQEIALLKQHNPEGAVPTYNFGCKYIRIGNAYSELNPGAEEIVFREIAEKLT